MTKEQKYIEYLYRWIRLGQSGEQIIHLLRKRKIDSIAIYGMDKLAECLMYELSDSDVELVAIIDKYPENLKWINYNIISVDEIEKYKVDTILVCPVAPYEEIIPYISKYTDTCIITFEELIYEL